MLTKYRYIYISLYLRYVDTVKHCLQIYLKTFLLQAMSLKVFR